MLARLKRLGVTRGTRTLRASADFEQVTSVRDGDDAHKPAALGQLFPGGRKEINNDGACFVLDTVYSADYVHGPHPLNRLLGYRPTQAGMLAAGNVAGEDFRDYVFLDTETTGLYGAGTYAFLVGVAYFEENRTSSGQDDAFVARQYFLRDPGDEAAMLNMLDELLDGKAGLVTFNGRNFDLPLLDRRFLMNRKPSRILDAAHIDLLPPARRLWRARLGSCALGSLEHSLLQLRRTGEDVPGAFIPGLYLDYLRTGNARPLEGVFYHNQVDLLSMVVLLQEAIRLTDMPDEASHPRDLLSLARWQRSAGNEEAAEQTYRLVLQQAVVGDELADAHAGLALLFKQTDQRDRSVEHWREAAKASPATTDYYVELAKYYEWQTGDLATAEEWTRRALEQQSARTGARLSIEMEDLQHRHARLKLKLAQNAED